MSSKYRRPALLPHPHASATCACFCHICMTLRDQVQGAAPARQCTCAGSSHATTISMHLTWSTRRVLEHARFMRFIRPISPQRAGDWTFTRHPRSMWRRRGACRPTRFALMISTFTPYQLHSEVHCSPLLSFSLPSPPLSSLLSIHTSSFAIHAVFSHFAQTCAARQELQPQVPAAERASRRFAAPRRSHGLCLCRRCPVLPRTWRRKLRYQMTTADESRRWQMSLFIAFCLFGITLVTAARG